MGYFKTIYTIDESPLWSNRKVPFYLNVYITLAHVMCKQIMGEISFPIVILLNRLICVPVAIHLSENPYVH
jgi:hypothetical protein